MCITSECVKVVFVWSGGLEQRAPVFLTVSTVMTASLMKIPRWNHETLSFSLFYEMYKYIGVLRKRNM